MIEGEPDWRGEPHYVKAEKGYHFRDLKAVWSEATKNDLPIFYISSSM